VSCSCQNARTSRSMAFASKFAVTSFNKTPLFPVGRV
jgi:hypothetical protein